MACSEDGRIQIIGVPRPELRMGWQLYHRRYQHLNVNFRQRNGRINRFIELYAVKLTCREIESFSVYRVERRLR